MFLRFSNCKQILLSQSFFNFPNLNSTTKHGIFDITELHSPAGFKSLEDKVICKCNGLKQLVITSNKLRKKEIIQKFDELSDTICQVADFSEYIRNCHPDSNYRKSANETYLNLSEYVEKLNTNYDLYQTLKKLLSNKSVSDLDDVDFLTSKLFLFDFEQSGIHLPKIQRDKFVELNYQHCQIFSAVGELYNEPIIISRKELFKGAEPYVGHNSTGKEFIIYGNYNQIENEDSRKFIYKRFYKSNPSLNINLIKLLNVRHEMSQLTGYNNYISRSLQNTLIESPSELTNYFEYANKSLKPLIANEITELQKVSNNTNLNVELPWNAAYLITKAKSLASKYNTDLTPYYPLHAVIDGLAELLDQLFELNLVPIYESEAFEPTGIPHMIKLEVFARQNNLPLDNNKALIMSNPRSLIGTIYLDLFARDKKPNLDCHFTLRGGRDLSHQNTENTYKDSNLLNLNTSSTIFSKNGHSSQNYQTPIIVVSTNLPATHQIDMNVRKYCVSPVALENLFHEMGHALHSIIGRTRYQHVTGTRCSTDFAEVPSNLMELFATDARVLLRMGRHVETGASPPENLIDSYLTAQKSFTALEYQTQLHMSVIDNFLHSRDFDSAVSLEDQGLREIHAIYNPYKYIKGASIITKFQHLLGYGAKYYSYLLARGIALDIWNKAGMRDDPYSFSKAGRPFHTLLKYGGQKDPQDIISEVFSTCSTNDKNNLNSNNNNTNYINSKSLPNDKKFKINRFADSLIINLKKNENF